MGPRRFKATFNLAGTQGGARQQCAEESRARFHFQPKGVAYGYAQVARHVKTKGYKTVTKWLQLVKFLTIVQSDGKGAISGKIFVQLDEGKKVDNFSELWYTGISAQAHLARPVRGRRGSPCAYKISSR